MSHKHRSKQFLKLVLGDTFMNLLGCYFWILLQYSLSKSFCSVSPFVLYPYEQNYDPSAIVPKLPKFLVIYSSKVRLKCLKKFRSQEAKLGSWPSYFRLQVRGSINKCFFTGKETFLRCRKLACQ